MIFITGDTHGDYRRFNTNNFPEQKELTKSDYIIVCGDFGIWDGSMQENYWLDWLENKPFTTLFVDGNHSNFDMLDKMPVEQWNGGQVHFVRDSVIHLMRGQVYEIAGLRFFTMGGATSHDIDDGILEPDDPNLQRKRKQLDRFGARYRINHISWWSRELPDDAEYETAKKNLAACSWKVNYIISHCAPSAVLDILGGGMYRHDQLTQFLEELRTRCEFEHWFCGHYHENRILMRKHYILYEQIIQIEPRLYGEALDRLHSTGLRS